MVKRNTKKYLAAGLMVMAACLMIASTCSAAKLTASTSLTIVNVTSFFNKSTPSNITTWEGDWPTSATVGYLQTGYRVVYMQSAAITSHALVWSTVPYPLPYAAFANGGSGMICNVYGTSSTANEWELASWDYISNLHSSKHLEHGMPDCWTGTMVHSFCGFNSNCNGEWKSNLYFSLYPPTEEAKNTCWGWQVMKD